MTNNERKEKIKKLKNILEKTNYEIAQLTKDCDCSVIVKDCDCARCDICGKYYGWYCPESPDHICDYEQEDGSYDEDSCRYCGQPDERK